MREQLSVMEKRGNTNCFSEVNFNHLLVTMKDRTFPEGTHLYWEGDVSDKLYYMKRGRAQITKSTDEGKELIMYMYQSGDMIGQADPFFGSKHTFSAEVLEDSEIGVLEHKDLEMLICQHCDFAIDFMKWMGIHHRLTQTKFRDLMLYGKPGALCSTLIRLSNSYGEPHGDHVIIHKKITHTDLSNMIGATRESVNRMLSDLRKKDAIEYDNGMIVIKDLKMLQGICHCELCPNEICRI
ncbi:MULTISPECIES: Crp/Fnr family transcriptional regulator [Paenibacillus]|jgi:CRP/FNR family transcriptional regulator|uniref:Anaerobic regulatory protein n=1 Tax=Paenibacillus illinoisensis TaxID=59845 RepID=A0A2W0CM98_9BACL|nr:MULTISPECIES: Crp/Fnr family transcriptional regulator [Paenibacillus]MBM6386478.1 Crp/Fnr family transcriptional regulator [Paenibacillus sp.]MCG7383561.1 Crp/Fnr family transcriptional regulator [Paenibacillus sp. ACRRY]PAD31322.1 hypothetical protein CHH60_11465 [Paenibacillus sp. 7523-1]PYY28938.1 Anaerobic regulatory protein [Paenibacillus illinoisensis]